MERSNCYIDKYTPNSLDEVVGHQKEISIIKDWITNFKENKITSANFKNGLLLSGPPGIGKTLISHLLYKEFNFDVLELNSSMTRTSKDMTDKIETIFRDKSVKTMFNKNAKTGIIIDEIDTIDHKKEYTTSDIVNLFYYETNRFYNKLKKKESKKKRKYIINKNPLICTCNSLHKTLKGIIPEVILIELKKPSDNDILFLLKKINTSECLGLSDVILQLIIPYCQYDFRRTIYVIELVASYTSDNKNYTPSDVIQFIKSLGTKDIDIGLYDGVNLVLNDREIEFDELVKIYDSDTNAVPYLIHENFISYVDTNTNNKLMKKIDICLEYYDFFLEGQLLKANNFGTWNLQNYIAYLTVVMPNFIIKNSNPKLIIQDGSLKKSAMISKYNYRYYNMKFINQLSKKLSISISNFSLISLITSISVFLDQDKLDYVISLFSDKLNAVEFQKVIKLSIIFEKFQKLFTKKVQNNIESKFNS